MLLTNLQRGHFYRDTVYITESLNLKTVKLLKLGVNYSRYNMAHAEPDTSSMGLV